MNQKRHTMFAEYLAQRIKRHGLERLTEDCIRYDYFSAIMAAEGRTASDILLEFAHPNQKYQAKGKKEIDCVLVDRHGKPAEALEFKYFAERDSYPRTMGIGAFFADCCRLMESGIPVKTLALVSAATMNAYIRKSVNKVDFLFDQTKAAKNISAAFFRSLPATAYKTIQDKTYEGFKPFPFSLQRIFLEENGSIITAIYHIKE
ncbi:hypothetical protein AGMMS50267_13230 [Spirochaetia bacterium]|nr:hypothetical protein AGMMS50267_13230 [Spirochaetia bacterium]